MHTIVSGASGLIGTALRKSLEKDGKVVLRLVRRAPQPGSAEVSWNPSEGLIDTRALHDIKGVVHLAGENIGSRWNAEKKNRIRTSRVLGTRTLAKAISSLAQLPQVLICASAIGFYGNRGAEWLDENSELGNGFLASVCKEWEEAAKPAEEKGIRVVNLRFGFVLAKEGGGLAKMLPIFRLGLGGRVGSGRQYISWVTIDDVVRAIEFAMVTPSLRGPVNVVAPNPVSNKEFTSKLGKILKRPTILPLPQVVAKLLLGEMAAETILSSQRVKSDKLLKAGFHFQYSELGQALQHVIKER